MFAISSSVALAASAALLSAFARPAAPPSTPATTTSATTRVAPDVPRIEPADPKRLQTLLPETVGPLKRLDQEAGLRSIGEMRSSLAQANFGIEGKPEAGHATVKIVDYIAMPGLVESVAPWRALEVDTESDSEYARTTLIGDHRAMETYVKQTKSGSINLLVAGRFVVTIEVTGLPPETLRTTAVALKLDDLAALAK